MRVWIDQDLCTGSGLCELIEPRVFVIADDGLARVQQDDRVLPPGPGGAALVPDGCADRVREAGQSCPGGCIRVENGDLALRSPVRKIPAPRPVRRLIRDIRGRGGSC